MHPMIFRSRYLSQRIGFAVASMFAMRVLQRFLRSEPLPQPSRSEQRAFAARLTALLQRDLAAHESGDYPADLLVRIRLAETLRALPEGLRDIPRVIRRSRANRFDDLPEGVDPTRYPAYYRRNFHWQSDGWLSERSARLYDPGVDLLFGGLTDVMRRAIIPPILDFVRTSSARPRCLDIATGTGRFVEQLAAALPDADYTLLDLSAPYLKEASRRLAGVARLQTVESNAEAMPLEDGSFDVVSCVFLFHELPKGARRNVMREALRVLRPGGLLAILDSAQLDDSAEIRTILESFPKTFHEPYYKGYLKDPLPAALSEVGFEVLSDTPALVSRAVIARRPEETR